MTGDRDLMDDLDAMNEVSISILGEPIGVTLAPANPARDRNGRLIQNARMLQIEPFQGHQSRVGMNKNFRLKAADIKPITEGCGGCVATDRMTVDGERVGYMYREAPTDPVDSGWSFFAGTESQEYLDEVANSGVFDVNTNANYDPEIVQFLDAPVGSRFVRWPPGSPLGPEPN